MEEDPSKMTVNELKSALTEHGFLDKIPQNERKPKAYFVGMYKELVLPVLVKERAAKRHSDPARLEEILHQAELPREDKVKSEAKRRQTVAAEKIAQFSEHSQPQQPSTPIHFPAYPKIASPAEVPAASPVAKSPARSPAPVTTPPFKQQATTPMRAASPHTPKTPPREVEITEEFYPGTDEEVDGEYHSPFLKCIKVSFVLIIITATLAVCLFLLPSLSRLPMVADPLEILLNLARGRQITYYCDTGMLPSPIPGHPLVNCTRCPLFGICSQGKLRCGSGYLIQRSKVDGKYVERCVRDEEEVRQVNELAERAREILGQRAGAYECKQEGVDSPGLAQEQLRDQLIAEFVGVKHKDDPDAIRKFDKLFFSMQRELLSHSEWNVIIKDQLWQSTEKSLPLLCDMKVRMWELKWYFLFSLFVASAVQLLFWRRSRVKGENQEVDTLVEEVKKLLCQQREASRVEDKIPPYLPLVHVRDTLFHDNAERKKRFTPKDRLRLWERVVKLVGEDRRIRTVPHMVEGEQQATWEWVSKLNVARDT